jgi:hypothetical protein
MKIVFNIILIVMLLTIALLTVYCITNINLFTNNDVLPYSIVIVGCARNIESYLKNTKEKIRMIIGLFKSSKVYIYENDSNDNTLKILQEWENEKLIELISEKNVPGLRTERLAHGRNILYNKAMKNNFDYLIVMDLDNVISDLDESGIKSCFNMTEKWAVVSANQKDNYYDLWALRTYNDWMPFDCWHCVHIGKKTVEYCVSSRYKNIPKNAKPIKVKSAFGGFAIYDKKYLNNCSYGNGLFNGSEVCEHVNFNQDIIKKGGDIYINPLLINC